MSCSSKTYAALLFISLAALAGLAGVSSGWRSRETVTKSELAGLRASVSELTERLDRFAALASRLERLEAAAPEERPAVPAVSEKDVERIVAKALEARSTAPAARPAEEQPAEAEAGALPDAESAAAKLLDPAVSRAEKQLVWKRVQESRWWDPVLAAFEARVKEQPANADYQSELGAACIQKLTAGASDQEKAQLAMKADRAFEAALKIDPGHWEARFQKATSLSYWPPIFGKQPEAIREFETLREQQESGAERPEFAQTYLFLGNLYLGRGEKEKAAETFRRGAERFPLDKALAQKAAPVE